MTEEIPWFPCRREPDRRQQPDVPGERGVAELCGPGGDAQPGLHNRLLPAERRNTSTGHPHGQIRAPSSQADRQVGLSAPRCLVGLS